MNMNAWEREIAPVYIVKPQFKPWFGKTHVLSHSLWGRSRPGDWLKRPYNIPFQRQGRLEEEGWRKRNSTHEEFVLTCRWDSLFVADPKAGKWSLVPGVSWYLYTRASPSAPSLLCCDWGDRDFPPAWLSLAPPGERGVYNGHIICHEPLLWRYLADPLQAGGCWEHTLWFSSACCHANPAKQSEWELCICGWFMSSS